MSLSLERLRRSRLFDFLAAVFAGSAFVVVPEIEHGLAKVLNDVAAIEIDVFHHSPALVAIEDDMFVFPRRTAAFDDDADRVRWTDGCVWDVRRNEKRFSLVNQVILDLVALPDADLDVAFELIKILFRIDQMKVVSGVWTLDDHDEKVAAIVEVAVTYRGLEEMAVLLDPAFEVDGWLNGGGGVAGRFW